MTCKCEACQVIAILTGGHDPAARTGCDTPAITEHGQLIGHDEDREAARDGRAWLADMEGKP